MDRRTIVARLLIAFALIVQIWAPIGSSRMVLATLLDPLAEVVLCHVDPAAAPDASDRGAAPHGFAHCDLCRLVADGGGVAPTAPVVVGLVDDAAAPVDAPPLRLEAPRDARLLARIRGRAPPAGV